MSSTWIHSRATALMLAACTFILALFVAVGPAHAVTGSTTLQAVVGPDPTITLMRDGAPVTSLEAGEYTIEVDDKSENHNFHLTGAGVDESTSVEEVTTATWTVTLSEGTYDFVCDPHAENMKGSFTVTAAGAQPAAGAGAEPATDAGAQPATGAGTQPATEAGAQPGGQSGELPFTGIDTLGLALLGASLLGVGLALTFVERISRPNRDEA